MRRWLLLFLLAALPSAGTAEEKALVVSDDVSDPLTLDPHRQFVQKNHTLLQQLYEGLVRFGPEGRIEPALATSWERLDPLTMRFQLRAGVRFHNGEPFDAEAVRFTLARYLDPATGFPAAGFVASISSVSVEGPLTVDIHTAFPDGLLLNRLAGFILVVPPRLLAEKGPHALETEPVGTGPFRFVRWERGREIVLAASKDYWKAGFPKVPELRFRFLPGERQVEALLKGEVDLVTELPGTMTQRVARNPRTRVLKKETFYTVGATLNTSSGPLADLRVRRALNHAIDRADLIRYDLLGNGRPLASLSMPGEEGHDSSLPVYAFDPARARALLREAGVATPLRLKALVYVQGERAARILARQFQAVGVEMDVSQVMNDAEAVRVIQSVGWDLVIGGVPDPMAHSFFIQSIYLYSRSPYALHHDPAYDRALEEMVATLEPAEREAKARALDRLVHEQALSLFTYQRIKTYGVSRRLRFQPWVTGMPYFDAAELADPGEGGR